MTLLILIYGFIAITSQVVFFRELLVLCVGNELSMGILLSSWLGWTAIGSFAGGRWISKAGNERQKFGFVLVILPVVLLLTIVLLRLGRIVFGLMVGELADPLELLIMTLLFLFPFCFASGMIFPILAKASIGANKISAASSIGKVYIAEGIGGGAGGLCLTFLMLNIWSSLEIIFFLLWLCVLMLLLFFTRQKSLLTPILLILIFTVVYFIVLFPLARKVDFLTSRFEWQGYKVLENVNTVYGNLVVTGGEGQRNFYENGSLLFTTGDVQPAEELIHFALLEHPRPEKILLIGSGVNGGLRQIAKHSSVKSVDYVELDPAIIRLGQKYLSVDELPASSGPRIRTIITDGRQWVQSTTNKYDVIILGLPDPASALLNRYFTFEFFMGCRKILTDSGIVAFRLTSSENYISETLGRFLGIIHQTLAQVFDSIVMIPGNTMYFLACPKTGVLTENYQILVERLTQRKIETMYFKGYYIPDRMSAERMSSAHERILQLSAGRINTDFYPVGYYYQMVLWSSAFSQRIRDFFTFLSQLSSPALLFTILLGLFFFPVLIIRGRKSVAFSAMVVGFSMIAFEMIILIGVQVLYGYLFSQIALLIACFMLGLASGAKSALWWFERGKIPFVILYKIQLFIIFYSLLIAAYFGAAPALVVHTSSVLIYLGCVLFMGGAGFLGGMHFQCANAAYSASRSGENIGIIYAVDLAGSCGGALLVSVFLLPLVGLLQTAAITCFWNAMAFTILLFAKPRS